MPWGALGCGIRESFVCGSGFCSADMGRILLRSSRPIPSARATSKGRRLFGSFGHVRDAQSLAFRDCGGVFLFSERYLGDYDPPQANQVVRRWGLWWISGA